MFKPSQQNPWIHLSSEVRQLVPAPVQFVSNLLSRIRGLRSGRACDIGEMAMAWGSICMIE